MTENQQESEYRCGMNEINREVPLTAEHGRIFQVRSRMMCRFNAAPCITCGLYSDAIDGKGK